MSTDRRTQTDHERDMERLATRLVQMNRRDAAVTGSDPRNDTGKQTGTK
ncbi:hypothetical protein [Acrocarpospora catenulata]|nr:hypothetical protein [Acrocarpospora catenulata]